MIFKILNTIKYIYNEKVLKKGTILKKVVLQSLLSPGTVFYK
jgi:hypothetical protein